MEEMAHVVGVPKRDSCQKCELPVFLAERMVVGKKIFHRTCLKCARCLSQLTPGSFYETEVDDEYCCETCPDEEDCNDDLLRSHDYNSNGNDVRSSVAERLAFFEKSNSTVDAVETKNISDEEKSKSLKHLAESATVSQSSFKMSAAFNDFLKSADEMEGIENNAFDEVDKDEESEQESTATSITSAPSEILQSDVSLTVTPKLPVSPPPTIEPRFTTTAQLNLQLNTEQDNLEINNEKPIPKMRLNNIPDSKEHNSKITAKTFENDKINNNGIDLLETYSTEQEYLKDLKIDLVENNITKDNTDNYNLAQISMANTSNDKEELQQELENLESESCTDDREQQKEEVEIRENSKEDVETTERLSVVRARLQQFEVNNNSENKEEEIELDNQSEKTLIAPSTIALTTVPVAVPPLTEVPLEMETEELTPVPLTATSVPLDILRTEQVPSDLILENTTKTETTKEEKIELDQPIENEVELRKTTTSEYPEDLNPFNSDDDEDVENKENQLKQKKDDLNPFDSSDDEIELEKLSKNSRPVSVGKVPPPRPPPPRISRNPFGEDEDFSRNSSLTSSLNKRTPVPTPRNNISQSSTPEPSPRINQKLHNNATSLNTSTYSPNSLQNTHEYYGSATSLSVHITPQHISRNSDMRASCASLVSSAGGTTRSRKKTRAPLPPPQSSPYAKSTHTTTPKELFPSTETVNSSKSCSPSSSTLSSPKSGRKKRLAPPPPKPARLETIQIIQTESKNSLNYPLQSESESKMCDEEKALLEGNKALSTQGSKRRLIPLDASLLADEEFIESAQSHSQSDDLKQQQLNNAEYKEGNVVYRRVIQPLPVDTPTHGGNPLLDELNATGHGRQLEKLKDNKEAQNRNRQSQLAQVDDLDNLMSNLVLGYSNKAAQGKWKRRKGPAPALPVPPRKVLQMLPLQEIRHELEIIEVQQQGLEKQGVILEQMIRDRCEGAEQKVGDADMPKTPNTKEVEDLILQLFELVNEKNELFRRQAELMYLRRQHRLEQEQADLEYEIRVLMAQPERNKTDTDKAREEALIARLVEVVQLRNDVIECLEMDRLREAEEDWSIKTTLEEHNAKREKYVESHSKKSTMKLSKKEKKRQKEAKKFGKGSKKADADKDADETELNEGEKHKNKKRKFSFLGNLVHT